MAIELKFRWCAIGKQPGAQTCSVGAVWGTVTRTGDQYMYQVGGGTPVSVRPGQIEQGGPFEEPQEARSGAETRMLERLVVGAIID